MSSRDFLFPFICFSQSERSPVASWTLCEPHIGIHFTKVHLILVVCSVILTSSRLSHRVCKLLAHVIRVLVPWASCPCPVLPEPTAGRLALWHCSCVLGRRPIPLLRHPALHLLCSRGLELGCEERENWMFGLSGTNTPLQDPWTTRSLKHECFISGLE